MVKRYPGGFRARRTRNEATLLLPYPLAPRSLRRRERRPALASEDDSGRDGQSADDLNRRQALVEEHECDDRGEERLEIGEQRRARRADLVDGREPEDVRQHERAENGEREADPGQPRDVEALVAELRRREEEQRDRDHREEDRAQPERRVPAHERRDRDGVRAPRRRAEDREEVAAEVRGHALAGARGHEDDTGEREGR